MPSRWYVALVFVLGIGVGYIAGVEGVVSDLTRNNSSAVTPSELSSGGTNCNDLRRDITLARLEPLDTPGEYRLAGKVVRVAEDEPGLIVIDDGTARARVFRDDSSAKEFDTEIREGECIRISARVTQVDEDATPSVVISKATVTNTTGGAE